MDVEMLKAEYGNKVAFVGGCRRGNRTSRATLFEEHSLCA